MEPILHNITPDTKEFMLVVGSYNADVARGFAQPVVGLRAAWNPKYSKLPPFSNAVRIEFVISRVPPVSYATSGQTPEMQRAAIASANLENNIDALRSIASDPWMRSRCVISNDGVFEMAKERFRARDFNLQQVYLKKFQPCPQAEHVRLIDEFCKPPEPEALAPIQSLPMARTPAEWNAMSDEERARLLFAWSDKWIQSSPAIARVSGTPIALPAFRQDDANEWKGPISDAEREAMRSDDWK
jgi:hypothetical protein